MATYAIDAKVSRATWTSPIPPRPMMRPIE